MQQLHSCIAASATSSQPVVVLARQLSQTMVCRCVPTLPTQLAEDLYGAAASYVDKAETELTSLSSSLNNNEQRLRRYISDINRGKWIIIASGKPSNLSQWLLTSVLFRTSVICFSYFEGSDGASVCLCTCMHFALQILRMHMCIGNRNACVNLLVHICMLCCILSTPGQPGITLGFTPL